MSELFVSLDVETLGPIPGKNPMVELGAAAYNIEGEVVSTWQSTISQAGWEADSATLKWWYMPANFDAFQKTKENTQEPEAAMVAFNIWVNKLGESMPVAYPAGFDYMFVYWYLQYYIGHSRPWSFSCLDVKSYVMASHKIGKYRDSHKRRYPRNWFHPHLKHTHGALDDAIEQGWMFIQAHRENLGLPLLQPGDFKLG